MKTICSACGKILTSGTPGGQGHGQGQGNSKELLKVHASIQLHGAEEFGAQLEAVTLKAEKLAAVLREIASANTQNQVPGFYFEKVNDFTTVVEADLDKITPQEVATLVFAALGTKTATGP